MLEILKAMYTHWASSATAFLVGALPSLTVPMLTGTWPGATDWPKAVAGGLIAAFALNMRRPADKPSLP